MDRREFLRLAVTIGAAAAFNVVAARRAKSEGPIEFDPGVKYWRTKRYQNTHYFVIADDPASPDRDGDVVDPRGITFDGDTPVFRHFAPGTVKALGVEGVRIVEHHVEIVSDEPGCGAGVRNALMTANSRRFCGARPLTAILSRVNTWPVRQLSGPHAGRKRWVTEFNFDEYPEPKYVVPFAGRGNFTDFAKLIRDALGME